MLPEPVAEPPSRSCVLASRPHFLSDDCHEEQPCEIHFFVCHKNISKATVFSTPLCPPIHVFING